MPWKRIVSLSSLVIFLFFATALPQYLAGDSTEAYVPDYGIFAENELQKYQVLSGDWTMTTGQGEQYDVHVPGCLPSGNQKYTLRRSFKLEGDIPGQNYKLIFWAAKQNLDVRVNGHLLESHNGDYPTIYIDLPQEILRFDKPNELEVDINDRLSARSSIPTRPKLMDPAFFSGLFGDVAIVAGPQITLSRIQWKTKVNQTFSSAEWRLLLDFRNLGELRQDSGTVHQLQVWAEWKSPDGRFTGASEPITLPSDPLETVVGELKGEISDPVLWSIETPDRYQFRIHIKEGSREWTVPVALGIRKLEWTDHGLLLNGHPAYLKGVTYYPVNYGNGMALSVEQYIRDLHRIKNMGFNLVEIPMIPPHPVVPEICSEIGLLLIPGSGLIGVPTRMFTSEQTASHLIIAMRRMIQEYSYYPSICAWGLADALPLDSSTVEQALSIKEELQNLDVRPFAVGFASRKTRPLPEGLLGICRVPPYDFPVTRVTIQPQSPAWLIGGIGAFSRSITELEEESKGDVRQSNAILRQLNALQKMTAAGYILDSFSDRQANWPLLLTGGMENKSVITRGMLHLDRSERIAAKKVEDALGRIKINAPVISKEPAEFPIAFPVGSLIIIAILLLIRKQNNVFKQKLSRVFAHTFGFLDDIRKSRYHPVAHPTIIALLTSSAMAILLEGWLYVSRSDFALDYLLTVLFPSVILKKQIVNLAWNPIYGMVILTAILFFILILFSIFLRLIAMPIKGRFTLRQAYSMVCWGSSHILLLMPIGLVQFRLMEYDWFRTALMILLLLFQFWYLVRFTSIIRISLKTSVRLSWAILIMISLVLAGTWFAVSEGKFAVLEYLGYYHKVVIPWIQS